MPSVRGEQVMWREAMKKMCADCPFGNSADQLHMRESLRPGRFKELCQSVFAGAYFPCHKTTEFDDDGELVPSNKERMCKGALEFVQRAVANREKSEQRAERKK